MNDKLSNDEISSCRLSFEGSNFRIALFSKKKKTNNVDFLAGNKLWF